MNPHVDAAQPEFFPEEVHEYLGNYVYRLIDPRTDQTFYVGKGVGNRVFDHARGEIPSDPDALLPPKLEIIRQIKTDGQEVGYIIHRHGLTASEALLVEAALIDAYPDLTNAIAGHGSGDTGMMKPQDIIKKYGLPEFPIAPEEKLVLINIPKLQAPDNRAEIYRLVRYCWRINRSRARSADYVLAVLRGVVVGAYQAHEWLPATPENFYPEIPYADGSEAHRFGFKGEEAAPDIWEHFVGRHGKRIVEDALKHDQNPIRYWNC